MDNSFQFFSVFFKRTSMVFWFNRNRMHWYTTTCISLQLTKTLVCTPVEQVKYIDKWWGQSIPTNIEQRALWVQFVLTNFKLKTNRKNIHTHTWCSADEKKNKNPFGLNKVSIKKTTSRRQSGGFVDTFVDTFVLILKCGHISIVFDCGCSNFRFICSEKGLTSVKQIVNHTHFVEMLVCGHKRFIRLEIQYEFQTL